MEYIITQKVIQFAQDVQRRTTYQNTKLWVFPKQ